MAWFRSRDDLTDVDPFLTTYISMIATQVVLSSRGDERRQSYLLLEKLLPSWDSQNAVEVVFGGSVAIPRLIVSPYTEPLRNQTLTYCRLKPPDLEMILSQLVHYQIRIRSKKYSFALRNCSRESKILKSFHQANRV